MTLYAAFIRHGDYDQKPGVPSAWQPYPLNEEGLSQASHAATRLIECCTVLGAHIHPEIDSSSLCRGWQTANIIQESLKDDLSVITHDGLAERSVGSVANLTVEEINTILDRDPRFDAPPPNWKSNSQYRLPLQGAESLMDAGHRVTTLVKRRLSEIGATDETNILKVFVGHGAAFRHAAHILDVLSFEDIAKLSMHHGEPVVFRIENKTDGPYMTKVWGEWKMRKPQEEFLD